MLNGLKHFIKTYCIDLNQYLKEPLKLVRAGVNQTQVAPLEEGLWEYKERATNGEIFSVPIKNECVEPEVGFLDWVNFVFGIEYFLFQSPQEFIPRLSDDLEQIFGFGITEERKQGLNFYERSFVLGNDWGFVCVGSAGNQYNTILVMVNGEGCTAAKAGWEEELYYWAKSLPRFRLTRVDVAHDDFEGNYTVDRAVNDYDSGLFGMNGRMPKIQQLGDWRNALCFDGRSVYIGSRKSGKLLRVYEKGRQLGEKMSEWVRIECELKNKDRYIPPDVLLFPGRYLAGTYPALSFLSGKQERIKTQKKTGAIVYQQFVETARRQFGKLIYYMSQVESSAEKVIDKLIVPEVPKRLRTNDFRFANTPVHGYNYLE